MGPKNFWFQKIVGQKEFGPIIFFGSKDFGQKMFGLKDFGSTLF